MYTLYNFDSVEENQQEIIEVLYKFLTSLVNKPDLVKILFNFKIFLDLLKHLVSASSIE